MWLGVARHGFAGRGTARRGMARVQGRSSGRLWHVRLMSKILIPAPRVPMVGANGQISAVWYQFFAQFLQGLADSPAAGVDAASIAKWDVAFAWGNHAAAGYVQTEEDPVFAASAAAAITASNVTNWDAAYSWGNHALAGYLTAAPAETDPVFAASHAADLTLAPAVADAAASAVAPSAAYAQAEAVQTVADLNATITKLNALLASLRAAGVLAP